jgi:hypothetical protein
MLWTVRRTNSKCRVDVPQFTKQFIYFSSLIFDISYFSLLTFEIVLVCRRQKQLSPMHIQIFIPNLVPVHHPLDKSHVSAFRWWLRVSGITGKQQAASSHANLNSGCSHCSDHGCDAQHAATGTLLYFKVTLEPGSAWRTLITLLVQAPLRRVLPVLRPVRPVLHRRQMQPLLLLLTAPRVREQQARLDWQ